MPKKQYFIKGKEEITDDNAPVISNEFVDVQPEGEYRGQTIEVKSDTKLEEDLGTGEAIIFRSFQFASNPEMFKNGRPSERVIFDSCVKGIESTLWVDGLKPAKDIPVNFVFAPDNSSFLINVWARPAMGNTLLEDTQTLTEIIHGRRQNRDEVQRSVPVLPTKKKKASRPAKTSI